MLKFLARRDPYQFLFPIGFLHAVVGGALWVSHAFFNTSYPGLMHAHHMFAGFLLSFAAGFLLTAIPKFTGSPSCTPFELTIAIVLSLLSLPIASPLLPLALLMSIAAFAIRRFRSRLYPPPPHFIFLPIGLSLGMIGAVFLFLAGNGWASPTYYAHGKLLLYSGTMLAFILGIGAKLVSALLGWAPLPTHQIESFQGKRDTRKGNLRIYSLPILQALLFVASFGVELAGFEIPGRIIRAGCTSWIGFHYWRLYKMPKTRGHLALWIWISGWLLNLGLWTHALFPELGVHAAHIFFIGGYGLMSLMIGSRVSLAHGGFSPEIEIRSPVFTGTGVTIVLAMLARTLSIAMPTTYIHHLGYAALTWIGALLIWGWFFIPKILYRDKAR